MSSILHVARNGNPLGQFRRDQIPDLLETGTLRDSDLYYDEARREWLPLSDWRERSPLEAPDEADEPGLAGEFGQAVQETAGRRRRSGRSRGPKKPRKRNPAESALPGWIACLFAIGAAAGLWAWAQSLRDQLSASEKKVQEMSEAIDTLRRQNSILLEMAPPNTVRGVLTTEPQPGRLAVMSGVSVALFRLDDVRNATLDLANEPTPITEEELSTLVTQIQSKLPPPLSTTLSDSSGRFELAAPEPGRYAIVSSAFRQGVGVPQRLLWLLEFDADGSPSPVISLSEANAISLADPSIRLSPAQR